jgi:predicted RNA-binding Zn-ribbon protein involved in translation (DUF1610 family)
MWRDTSRNCESCGVRFAITADEQRFWYLHLRIPEHVTINRCQECRWKQRVVRRISERLSMLLPRLADGGGTILELREAVLAIAEGLLRRWPCMTGDEMPFLCSTTIIEKGAALIVRARRVSRLNDDLIPVQILFHDRLGHHQRAIRLNDELLAAGDRSPAIGRAIRHVSAWLATPDLLHRRRILNLP